MFPGKGQVAGATYATGASSSMKQVQQRFQAVLDKCTPMVTERWVAWVVVVLVYAVRVFFLKGFYIVTYAMGIYNLNLLLGFLTPLHVDADPSEPTLPSKADEEFRPFVRRLPEFKFWYASFRSLVLGFAATFFPVFDVPVFWPILLLYWIVLFLVTMKRQIQHMIKYRYIPFSFGKKRYSSTSGPQLGKSNK